MGTILILFLVLSVLVYAAGRYKLVKNYWKNPLNSLANRPKSFNRVVQEVFPELPELKQDEQYTNGNRNLLTDTPLRQSIRALDSLSIISGLGESAWTGLEMIHNLSAVNEHVYDALSQMAGAQLASIGDLHANLQDWAQDWYGGLTERAINNLQGHVAEQVVADHLRELGHHVQFAEHSNQSGWDFLVDGQNRVNVKDVADVSSISHHFEKYPDIPSNRKRRYPRLY